MCASTFENLITRSYYRCNGSFGDMLHSTHGIGGTRNIVVYACPNTNRVCENVGNCYTDTDHEDGYLDESTLADIDVCHWLSWEHSYNVFILAGIEINEQLSLRNSFIYLLHLFTQGKPKQLTLVFIGALHSFHIVTNMYSMYKT